MKEHGNRDYDDQGLAFEINICLEMKDGRNYFIFTHKKTYFPVSFSRSALKSGIMYH